MARILFKVHRWVTANCTKIANTQQEFLSLSHHESTAVSPDLPQATPALHWIAAVDRRYRKAD